MLDAYENDHSTGMDTREIAELIYEYTSGYAFLVSKLCKIMDEEIAGSARFLEKKMAWTYSGFPLKKGYMVSFNFNRKKKVGINRMVLGDKVLVEAVV